MKFIIIFIIATTFLFGIEPEYIDLQPIISYQIINDFFINNISKIMYIFLITITMSYFIKSKFKRGSILFIGVIISVVGLEAANLYFS